MVFQKRFTTIASIPPPCGLNFSRTLKAALDKVLTNPKELSAWLHLLMLPICTLNLYMPKCSKEERSGVRKKLQMDSINQALVRWKKSNRCINIIEQLLAASKQDSQPSKPTRKKKFSPNLQACKKKLSYGHYTAVIRVLSSNGLAPNTAETLQELSLKHPSAPPPSIPAEPIDAAALSVDSKSVLDA